MVTTVNEVCSTYMIAEEHLSVPFTVHKDGTRALCRFMDFLERFVTANQALIASHEEKLASGKRTRRVVPTRMFRHVTTVMAEMREIFKQVQI